MGRTSQAVSAAPDARDYEAFWEKQYKRARREGMSEGMARYVARAATLEQELADKGLKAIGSGDFEFMY